MLETVPKGGQSDGVEPDTGPNRIQLFPREDLLKPPTLARRLRGRLSPLSKFAKGALFNFGAAAAYEAISLSGGAAMWYSGTFNPELTNPVTLGALALSSGIMAFSVWANGEVNLKMMKQEGVEFNSSLLTMGIYKLTKMVAKKEKAADWSLRLTSYAWDIGKQSVALTAGAVFDPNATIGINFVGSTLNFIQAGVGLSYLKLRHSHT